VRYPGVEDFIAYISAVRSRSTANNYRYALYLAARELGKDPGEATLEELRQLVARLKQAGRPVSTIRFVVSAVKRYLRYRGRHGDAYMLDSPKAKRELGAALTEEQVGRILDYLYNKGRHRDAAVVALAYICALRASEAHALDVEDIDLKQRIVYVRPAKRGEGPVAACYCESRLAWMFRYVEAYISQLPPAQPGARRPLAMCGGSRCSKRYIMMVFKKASKRVLGIPYRFHTLRHSRATNLAKMGAHIMLIKMVLRHRSLSSTQVYIHLSPAAVVQMLESLPNISPQTQIYQGA